jgi:hypothetical protein
VGGSTQAFLSICSTFGVSVIGASGGGTDG